MDFGSYVIVCRHVLTLSEIIKLESRSWADRNQRVRHGTVQVLTLFPPISLFRPIPSQHSQACQARLSIYLIWLCHLRPTKQLSPSSRTKTYAESERYSAWTSTVMQRCVFSRLLFHGVEPGLDLYTSRLVQMISKIFNRVATVPKYTACHPEQQHRAPRDNSYFSIPKPYRKYADPRTRWAV